MVLNAESVMASIMESFTPRSRMRTRQPNLSSVAARASAEARASDSSDQAWLRLAQQAGDLRVAADVRVPGLRQVRRPDSGHGEAMGRIGLARRWAAQGVDPDSRGLALPDGDAGDGVGPRHGASGLEVLPVFQGPAEVRDHEAHRLPGEQSVKGVATFARKASIAWKSTSMPVLRVTSRGSDTISSGSTMATLAMVLSLPVPGFSWCFVFVMTHHGVVSDPVPAVVVTHTMGKAGSVRASVACGPPAR